MVFAESPRRVTANAAREIIDAVKKEFPGVETVGVFVNVPVEELNRTSDACRLDRVQLSGEESIKYCRYVERPIIKAIKIPVGKSVDSGNYLEKMELSLGLLNPEKFTLLLDTYNPGKSGGTGESFNWELARPFCSKYRAIVAGGLHHSNVVGLIKKIKPWGVDVSSGVETGGRKDTTKIIQFIEAVRRADNEIKIKTVA
jgi:phosphoribosylanthranilate isomerase